MPPRRKEAEVGQLVVRKLADRSEQERVVRFDPMTGEKILVNPENSNPDDLADVQNWTHEPWPLAGVAIVGDAPARCHIPTHFAAGAAAEGWLTLEGEQLVHRPGGPPEEPWRTTHTFVHGEALVIHTTDGDVRYRVVQQPDKYVDSDDPKEKVTDEKYAAGETRVDWFYDCELEA